MDVCSEGPSGALEMKKLIKPALYIAVGLILGFPVFSVSYYTMVHTSTPQFCATCHEIQFAYNSWKTSTHVNNSQGFVADCMDCHLPAPHDTFDFFYAKTWHGIKDIVVHFTQESYDHQKNREVAWVSIKNDQCLKCHRNLLHMPTQRGAMLAHRSVVYARPGYEKKCVDCHYDLVHSERGLVMFRQARKVTYQAKGLRRL